MHDVTGHAALSRCHAVTLRCHSPAPPKKFRQQISEFVEHVFRRIQLCIRKRGAKKHSTRKRAGGRKLEWHGNLEGSHLVDP